MLLQLYFRVQNDDNSAFGCSNISNESKKNISYKITQYTSINMLLQHDYKLLPATHTLATLQTF